MHVKNGDKQTDGKLNSRSWIFHNLDKDISQFGQIHFMIWKKTFHNMDNKISQFGRIHLANILMRPTLLLPEGYNFKTLLPQDL